jgi:hypothetical protein
MGRMGAATFYENGRGTRIPSSGDCLKRSRSGDELMVEKVATRMDELMDLLQRFQWLVIAAVIAFAIVVAAVLLRPHHEEVTPQVACVQSGGNWVADPARSSFNYPVFYCQH